MPPPTVTCYVCGSVVGKSTTVCIGKDKTGNPMRCCKSHPEAKQAVDFQKAEKEKESAKLAKERQLAEQSKIRNEQKWVIPPSGPHCWVCDRKGIFMNEVYLRLLKESLKSEMEGRSPMEIFDGTLPARVARSIKAEGLVVLSVIPDMTADQMNRFWKLKDMHIAAKEAMAIAHQMIICAECADKLKITVPVPETKYHPTPEQLLMLSAVMEPVFDDIREDIRQSN